MDVYDLRWKLSQKLHMHSPRCKMCWCLSVGRADFELQVDYILALIVITARVTYVLGRKDKILREESCGL